MLLKKKPNNRLNIISHFKLDRYVYCKICRWCEKVFSSRTIKIDQTNLTIRELLDLLLELKPTDTPKLDTDNVLIAIMVLILLQWMGNLQ